MLISVELRVDVSVLDAIIQMTKDDGGEIVAINGNPVDDGEAKVVPQRKKRVMVNSKFVPAYKRFVQECNGNCSEAARVLRKQDKIPPISAASLGRIMAGKFDG